MAASGGCMLQTNNKGSTGPVEEKLERLERMPEGSALLFHLVSQV